MFGRRVVLALLAAAGCVHARAAAPHAGGQPAAPTARIVTADLLIDSIDGHKMRDGVFDAPTSFIVAAGRHEIGVSRHGFRRAERAQYATVCMEAVAGRSYWCGRWCRRDSSWTTVMSTTRPTRRWRPPARPPESDRRRRRCRAAIRSDAPAAVAASSAAVASDRRRAPPPRSGGKRLRPARGLDVGRRATDQRRTEQRRRRSHWMPALGRQSQSRERSHPCGCKGAASASAPGSSSA